MAIMQYHDTVYFISFSEREIHGRNSSIQSVPTAFNLFYNNLFPKKKLCFYFLNTQGNAQTDYQILIYRLMETIGFEFINAEVAISSQIVGFSSIQDIMYSRDRNSRRNTGNNSTYITKSGINDFDIYGKTYGANKYETSIMCYALSIVAKQNQEVTLYEMSEGNLVELPSSSLNVLRSLNKVKIIATNEVLEKEAFDNEDSLRSPRYIYNLLKHLGQKHCAMCECEVPEIIQGAHIWPVSAIKGTSLSSDEKMRHATSGDNGLWLCENHHKLFDLGLISINERGEILHSNDLGQRYIRFMDKITTVSHLPDEVLTQGFIEYLRIRNQKTIH